MPRRTHSFSLGCPTSCLLLSARVYMEVHVTLLFHSYTHTGPSQHKLTHSYNALKPSALPPQPGPFLCCCQIKAWKAGHKGECAAAARADTRTAAKPTADQMRVLKILAQLAVAADWRGVAAQERAARAVAAAMRTSMRSKAAWMHSERPSSITRSTWRLQRRWATGGGRAWHIREPRVRVSVAGGPFKSHQVLHAVPGDCKGGGRPGGGGQGVR